MFIAAVFPAIEFGYGYPLKWLLRRLDRPKEGGTKKTTIQQYVNLHAGPDHLLHFKYSSVLNITFITFMYGLALPVLFPIALLAFFVLYVTEKLTLTYFYKKPPMYDEKLNDAALGILKWAPIAMVMFGFWIMGNVQLFTSNVGSKDFKTQPPITNHNVGLAANQALPLFIFFLIFFIGLFFNDFWEKLLIRAGYCKKQKEDEVDEKLGNYFECLTPYQRKSWYIEERYMQRDLKVVTLD